MSTMVVAVLVSTVSPSGAGRSVVMEVSAPPPTDLSPLSEFLCWKTSPGRGRSNLGVAKCTQHRHHLGPVDGPPQRREGGQQGLPVALRRQAAGEDGPPPGIGGGADQP